MMYSRRLLSALPLVWGAAGAALAEPPRGAGPATDPPAAPADSKYWLPYEAGKSYGIMQGNDSGRTHKDSEKFAFDFDMTEGTRICAARGGKVIEVRKHFTEGGIRQDLWGTGNVVVIDHGDGTIARYLHLQKDGALVDVGDVIYAGDLIALSGNTGYTSAPHLHFVVKKKGQAVSVPIRFEDVPKDGGVPQEGKRYTSGNIPAIPPAVREEALRLSREAGLAWEHGAYGLSYGRYKKVAETKVTVPFAPVETARQRLAEFEPRCQEAIEAATKSAGEGRLEEAAERILCAKNAFANTPFASKLRDGVLALRKNEGYAAAAKAVERRERAHAMFLKALESELKGTLTAAASGYDACAKFLPDSPAAKAASERKAAVQAQLQDRRPPPR